MITGIAGVRPDAPEGPDVLVVDPLLPSNSSLDWWVLDNVLFRGREVAVAWDSTGEATKAGQGLSVWLDGCKVARRPQLGRLAVRLSTGTCREQQS